MATKTNSLSHTKWMCKYHIVFTPKYTAGLHGGGIFTFADRLGNVEALGGKVVFARNTASVGSYVVDPGDITLHGQKINVASYSHPFTEYAYNNFDINYRRSPALTQSKVRFDANGGSFAGGETRKELGYKYTIETVSAAEADSVGLPTRTYATFLGWAPMDASNDPGKVYDFATPTLWGIQKMGF